MDSPISFAAAIAVVLLVGDCVFLITAFVLPHVDV
jgi:hypothetical protein